MQFGSIVGQKIRKYKGIYMVFVCLSLLVLSVNVVMAGESWVLENENVKFLISKQTGAIEEGWNVVTGERYFLENIDVYRIMEEGIRKMTDETKDVVSDQPQVENSGNSVTLTLRCSNKDLQPYGMSITKKYTLGKKDNLLVKKTALQNKGNRGMFIRLDVNTSLDLTFRRNGYYYVPKCNPQVRASEVNVETPISYGPSPGEYAACALVNNSKGYSCSNYVYRVNDKLSFFESFLIGGGKPTTFLTPAGWKYNALFDYLKARGTSSVEVHYLIFKGDSSRFFIHYFNLPDITALLNQGYQIPGWMNEVKATMMNSFVMPAQISDEAIEKFKNFSNRLGKGNWMVILGGMWAQEQGDYYYEGKDVDYIKERLAAFRKQCPQVKISLYTFLWSTTPDTRVYNEHPDWLVRDKNGETIPFGYGDFKQIAIPECREFFAKRYAKMVEVIRPDFVYIDGGGIEPARYADWGNHLVSQSYDWYLFHKGIYDAVKKVDKNIGVFWNYPILTLGDAGFIEAGVDQLAQGYGNWQTVSDLLYMTKVSTMPPMWAGVLNWGDVSLKDRLYPSYFLALGLKPNLSPILERKDYNPGVKDYDFWNARIPYVKAAYEIKDTSLVDANISPSWRREETDTIDIFSLRQKDTCLLTAIGFNKETMVKTISADTAKLGLNSSKPTFLWMEEMVDPLTVDLQTRFVVKHADFKILDSPGDRIETEFKLEPYLVRLLTISQVPGFIYSIEGELSQMRLSNSQGIDIAGNFDKTGKKITLTVKSTRETCEIMIPYPFEVKDEPKITLDESDVKASEYFECNQRFLVVEVPGGDHTINVTPHPGKFALEKKLPVKPSAELNVQKVVTEGPAFPDVTLKNEQTEITLKPCGGMLGESLPYQGKIHLGSIYFYLHYNDGVQQRAGTQLIRWDDLKLDNLEIVSATDKLSETIAHTKLNTGDGNLAVEIDTSLENGSFVRQVFKFTNIGEKLLQDLRFYHYTNLSATYRPVDGDEADFIKEDNALYTWDPKGTIWTGITSPRKVDHYYYGIYYGPVLFMFLDYPVNVVRKNQRNTASGLAEYHCWDLGTLGKGESISVPIIMGVSNSHETLKKTLSEMKKE